MSVHFPQKPQERAVNNALIELKGVSFRYPDGVFIFEGLDLQIMHNDLLIIRGESGAGKSTFLRLFNRFCDPVKGTIFFSGKDIREYQIEKLRSSVVYLHQIPHMVDGTIEHNLSFPFSFQAHTGRTLDRDRAREWMEYFQMDVPLSHQALHLSIGQRQRIALIRSLLLEPDVLLLDEPVSALDSSNRKLIEQRIEDLAVTRRGTVLLATHSDIQFSHARVRTLLLEKGKMPAEQ